MVDVPSPFRAALGLVAMAFDEAKRLPDRAIELPMLAVSQALQLSLKAQQRYAALEARGDELLAARSVGDEPPSWATFDDPVATPEAASADAVATEALAEEVVETAVLIDEAAQIEEAAQADDLGDAATPSPSPRRPRPNKTVRPPRGSSASAFDRVRDLDDPLEPAPGE